MQHCKFFNLGGQWQVQSDKKLYSNPPAKFNTTLQLYETACNATAPSFALNISNMTFAIDPRDMFLSISLDGLCATSITQGFAFNTEAYPEGFYALGAAFLNNVVAVFDVGGGGMWFAPHQY